MICCRGKAGETRFHCENIQFMTHYEIQNVFPPLTTAGNVIDDYVHATDTKRLLLGSESSRLTTTFVLSGLQT